jgi:hypothetical protein
MMLVVLFFDSPVTFDSRGDSQAKYMSFCKVCTSLILQSLLDVAYFIALFSNAIIAWPSRSSAFSFSIWLSLFL